MGLWAFHTYTVEHAYVNQWLYESNAYMNQKFRNQNKHIFYYIRFYSYMNQQIAFFCLYESNFEKKLIFYMLKSKIMSEKAKGFNVK